MRSMKLLQVAVVSLVVVALHAGKPALAAGTGSANLSCVADPTDPDYGASGVAKLSRTRPLLYPGFGHSGQLSVTCKGLTPGAMYWVDANGLWGPGTANLGLFTASNKGTATFQHEVWGFVGAPFVVVVFHFETVNGTVVLIPLLEGTIVWP